MKMRVLLAAAVAILAACSQSPTAPTAAPGDAAYGTATHGSGL
ncbi:MAG TPA: hypothetical protein VHG28_02320 [Longimicrobiaceae bacterium]|nr:hypothetical protein [Longimicrobiaceae bacterium]